tara:strand:- start:245 stop:862 length:618 start_codon:yes stop_codon:yes gene_type:complete
MKKYNFNPFFLIKTLIILLIINSNSYSDNIKKETNLVVLGEENAPVKIKVFSSLTCPHCANFHIKVIPKIKKKYVNSGVVQLIFIDFPLDQAAFDAAKLLHCLDKKKQLTYLDNIYKSQNEWTADGNMEKITKNLKLIVKNLGISDENFNKCLNDNDIADRILIDRMDGQRKYSINSTPTIIINEKKLEGSTSFENIEKKIEKLI